MLRLLFLFFFLRNFRVVISRLLQRQHGKQAWWSFPQMSSLKSFHDYSSSHFSNSSSSLNNGAISLMIHTLLTCTIFDVLKNPKSYFSIITPKTKPMDVIVTNVGVFLKADLNLVAKFTKSVTCYLEDCCNCLLFLSKSYDDRFLILFNPLRQQLQSTATTIYSLS